MFERKLMAEITEDKVIDRDTLIDILKTAKQIQYEMMDLMQRDGNEDLMKTFEDVKWDAKIIFNKLAALESVA